MTDDETLKALECLYGKSVACIECEYKKRYRYGKCREQVAKDVFDLINRQKAENERLQKLLDDKCDRCIERNKKEAYKEFTGKLENALSDSRIVSDFEYVGYDCSDVHICIDNLLKEMVGENNV